MRAEAGVGPSFHTWTLFTAAWVGHMVLRQFYDPGHPARVGATVVLIVALAAACAGQVRIFRALDEFQRQVQLLAIGFAYATSVLAVFALGFLRADGFLQKADPRDLAGLMLMLYVVGLVVAWRRYR